MLLGREEPLLAQSPTTAGPARGPGGGAGSGSSSTLIAYFRASTLVVGIASFAAPWAFQRLGLLLGPLAVVIAGLLSSRSITEALSTSTAVALLPTEGKRQGQYPWDTSGA